MIFQKQHYLIIPCLLLLSSPTQTVTAFSTFTRYRRSPTTLPFRRTVLSSAATPFPTEGYLQSLANVIPEHDVTWSGTDSYLNGLSQILLASDNGMDGTEEEHLAQLSNKIVEVSSGIGEVPSFDDVSSTFSASSSSLDSWDTVREMALTNDVPNMDVDPISVNVNLEVAMPPTEAIPVALEASGSGIGDISTPLQDAVSSQDFASAVDSFSSTVDSFSSTVDTVTSNTDATSSFLGSQLSDISYDTLQTASSYTTTTTPNPTAFESTTAAFQSFTTDLSTQLSSAQTLLQKLTSSPAAQSLLDAGKRTIQTSEEETVQLLRTAVETEKVQAEQVADELSRLSLQDIASSIVHGIQFTSKLVWDVLSIISDDAIGSTGTLDATMAQTKSAIDHLYDGAVTSINTAITTAGDTTLRELVTGLIALFTAVARVLVKVLDAVVQVLSGRSVGDWASQAEVRIEGEAVRLLSQVNGALDDVTHRSVGELSVSVGHFSENVGHIIVDGVGGALGDSSQALAQLFLN